MLAASVTPYNKPFFVSSSSMAKKPAFWGTRTGRVRRECVGSHPLLVFDRPDELGHEGPQRPGQNSPACRLSGRGTVGGRDEPLA